MLLRTYGCRCGIKYLTNLSKYKQCKVTRHRVCRCISALNTIDCSGFDVWKNAFPTLISTNQAHNRPAAAGKLTWSQSRSVCHSLAPLDRGSNSRPVWFLLRSLRWKKNSRDHCERYLNGSVFSENTHGSWRVGKRNRNPHDTEGMLPLVRESEATNSCKFTRSLSVHRKRQLLASAVVNTRLFVLSGSCWV